MRLRPNQSASRYPPANEQKLRPTSGARTATGSRRIPAAVGAAAVLIAAPAAVRTTSRPRPATGSPPSRKSPNDWHEPWRNRNGDTVACCLAPRAGPIALDLRHLRVAKRKQNRNLQLFYIMAIYSVTTHISGGGGVDPGALLKTTISHLHNQHNHKLPGLRLRLRLRRRLLRSWLRDRRRRWRSAWN